MKGVVGRIRAWGEDVNPFDVKTTEIYARANLEMKRKALEKVADAVPLRKIPSWKQNKTLLAWLHSL